MLVVQLLADSSPRAGKDWLFSELYMLPLPLLRRFRELSILLCNCGTVDIHDSDEVKLYTDELNSLQVHHKLVPVAIGVGNQGLIAKYLGLLHSLRLETSSWDATGRLMSSVSALCTDGGAEIGLATMPPLAPEQFMTTLNS